MYFRIRWALGDGGMESELGKIHDPDSGRMRPWAVTVSLGSATLSGSLHVNVGDLLFVLWLGSDLSTPKEEFRHTTRTQDRAGKSFFCLHPLH